MGVSGSSQTSTPLTPAQRLESFQGGLSAIKDAWRGEGADGMFAPYAAPQINDPGAARQLSGGDYGRLERSIVTSRTAPLDTAWARMSDIVNQEMSDRGMLSSGAGLDKKVNIFRENFLPVYQQAGADAATQRYGLEANELAGVNQYGLSRSNMLNQLMNEQALQKYNSLWRAPEWLQGLYNNTGGAISSSSGGGWTI